MADEIMATVEGVVRRAFKAGAVVSIQRSSKDGEDRWKDYVTVWGLFGVSEGDRVRVSGQLSSILRFYEGRPQVQTSLNGLTDQDVLEHAAPSADADGEPVGAGWGV
ncbi:MAG: hypothetical protein ACTH93_05215 [Pseudoclavibacter sp.]